MSDDQRTIRAVAWLELFPALRLLSALRMAINSRALVLAAMALVGTSAGWRLCGEIFSGTSDMALQSHIKINETWPWEQNLGVPQLDYLARSENWRAQSPLVLAWNEISAPFVHMYQSDISFTHFAYLLCCGLWALAVWSFFGGAITRQAAVTIARQENQSWRQLSGFVRPRLSAYFVAPLFPILGTFMVAALMGVLGLLMRTGVGIFLAGLVWPLVLLGGFVMAFLLIGLFVGWPLMWGAVSAEGTDSFGALSHSYSYAYQRPLHYLIYASVAAVIGLLGWYLVSLFATWIIVLSNWGISWGSGSQQIHDILTDADLGRIGNAGAMLIRFWNGVIVTLAAGFTFSYFWSASTVIYFLLRRLVDATEIDEVYLPEEQQLYGLPPLKTGPDGVPEVADDLPPTQAASTEG